MKRACVGILRTKEGDSRGLKAAFLEGLIGAAEQITKRGESATSVAKATEGDKTVIAALKRCATPNRSPSKTSEAGPSRAVRVGTDGLRSSQRAPFGNPSGTMSFAGLRGRMFPAVLLALCTVAMLGCSSLENRARDAAAALSGSIVAAQTKYQVTCSANPVQEICQVINRGVSGENALITAIETYCGWSATMAPPDPSAKCVPVKSAQAALEAAIANAATLTAQIKGAL